MNNGGRVVWWNFGGQFTDEDFHCGDRLEGGGPVLLDPAGDLALEVIAGPSISFEADRMGMDAVQPGEVRAKFVVDLGSLVGREVSQPRIPKDAPLDIVHHIKWRAYDVWIETKVAHPRRRHLRMQRLHDAIFSVN